MSHRALLTQWEATQAGEPWYGPSRAAVLARVTAEEAATVPPGGGPTIWGLVLHMTAWTREVGRRLAGHPADTPPEGDWPPLPARRDARAWRAACRTLAQAHAEVLAVAAALPPAARARPVRRADGGPADVTVAEMLVGLAQHDAYHVGQVATTRRVLRAAR